MSRVVGMENRSFRERVEARAAFSGEIVRPLVEGLKRGFERLSKVFLHGRGGTRWITVATRMENREVFLD